MYRHNSSTKRKDGTSSVYTIYRCKGLDQAPSKCGNAVPGEGVEAWFHQWFTQGEHAICQNRDCRRRSLNPATITLPRLPKSKQDLRGPPSWLEMNPIL